MGDIYNILFYNENSMSYEILVELSKNKLLNDQILKVDIRKANVPDKIAKINKYPILITNGFNQPIIGIAILTWLKNNSFKNTANGYKFGDLDHKNNAYTSIGDEIKRSNTVQSYNADYNKGFNLEDATLRDYALNNESTHIDIYDDSMERRNV